MEMDIENRQPIIAERESSEIIKRLSFVKSYEAEYKTCIIWLAEKMNDTTSNKLLKILEEPPDKTLFILITENYDQILPTIISRTRPSAVPFNCDGPSQACWHVADYERRANSNSDNKCGVSRGCYSA